MKILILSPYPPYPPHGGGTMRIYRIIRGLSARHAVTCLTFAADPTAEAALAPLRDYCRMLIVSGPPVRGVARRAWTTLASPLPDMSLRNASPAYTLALADLLAQKRYDLVQAESIEMAQYLLQIRATGSAGRRPRLVLDQFNAEYVLQKRAALTSLRAIPRSLRSMPRNLAGGVYSLAQWLKLAAFERRVMRECDAVAAVSQDDARILARLAPGARIGVVPNGVDTAEFSRSAVGLLPEPGPLVVFSGTLDFRPNVDAVVWFTDAVWPLVRAQRPDARFIVVGRRPAPALRALADAGRLTLTGEVPDARPYLAGAAVYIVPMRIGGGVRLKLLEALALEAPVVSTAMGVEGVAGLRAGEHCLVADEPQAFASATLRLIDDQVLGRRLGAAGRALVRASYDWELIIPQLEALYRAAADDVPLDQTVPYHGVQKDRTTTTQRHNDTNPS